MIYEAGGRSITVPRSLSGNFRAPISRMGFVEVFGEFLGYSLGLVSGYVYR